VQAWNKLFEKTHLHYEAAADLEHESSLLPQQLGSWAKEKEVLKWIEYFAREPKGRVIFLSWLTSLRTHLTQLQHTLKEFDLPQSWMCVAMIESGLNPSALSSRGALGLWQLSSAVMSQVGLRDTFWMDERVDVLESTRAAALLLRSLRQRFGSWELALAAYNWGTTAVTQAILKYNTNSYWRLARLGALPSETQEYVPRIFACATILERLTAFGFDEPVPAETQATLFVKVPAGVHLSVIAEASDVPLAQISALNPAYVRKRIPPEAGPWFVRIPQSAASRFEAQWSRKLKGTAIYAVHRAKKNETISSIAERYLVTETELRETNALRHNESIREGTTLLVGKEQESKFTETPVWVTVPDHAFAYGERVRVFYRIGPGDDLHKLSKRFRVSIPDVCQWNTLDSRAALRTGMMVQLFVPRDLNVNEYPLLRAKDVRLVTAGSRAFFEHRESLEGRVPTRYTVREGDTVKSICQHFGQTLTSLSRINNLDPQEPLAPGRELTVYTSPELLAD